jgi:hypothetical protein
MSKVYAPQLQARFTSPSIYKSLSNQTQFGISTLSGQADDNLEIIAPSSIPYSLIMGVSSDPHSLGVCLMNRSGSLVFQYNQRKEEANRKQMINLNIEKLVDVDRAVEFIGKNL